MPEKVIDFISDRLLPTADTFSVSMFQFKISKSVKIARQSDEEKLLVWSVPGAPSKKNCWSGLVWSGPADQRTRTGPNGPADQQIYNTG